MPLTPMMKQYLETKEKYQDCILFYRLGDFYEMFFDDAVTASKVLDLVLTGRDCGLQERAPMCGVPYHSAQNYIAKLIENNFKVAICEQMTLPEESEGLVEREVIKVVTAGTVMEDGLLKEDKNNFIASVYYNGGDIGIAWADISTGEFYLRQVSFDEDFTKLCDTLLSFMPSEVICNQKMFLLSKDLNVVKFDMLPKFSCYYDWAYSFETAENGLKKQLNVNSLKAFECEGKKESVSAAGGLLEYISETQKRTLSHINRIVYVKDNKYMTLDNNTRRNLELARTMRDGKKYGSLLWLLDGTRTGMGARYLYSCLEQPLNDIQEIENRLNGVEELISRVDIREGIKEQLSGIRDIERLAAKCSYGNLNPKDCLFIKNTFNNLPPIKECLVDVKSDILREIYGGIYCFTDIVKLLNAAISDNPPQVLKDGGIIREGYSSELDEQKNASGSGKMWLARLESAEREKTGIKNLRIGYNKVFGYYIEVTKSNLEQVPVNYIRKQTISNCERFITTELKEIENKILGADEQSIKLEISLFNGIVIEIGKYIRQMQETAKSIAKLDTLISFAETALKYNYCKPVIAKNGSLSIESGRHPVVEAISKNEEFVPNDTFLDGGENRIMIITGPNMAGKSTYMRQVALITLMAHIGSFVPAKKAEIPLTDRIFTRVGALDNLAFDQSTFMVEMTEVANILHNATDKSLLILDEVGRGTSTFDGLSIAWSVMEYISKKLNSKTLFATHYHELTELEGTIGGVKNFRVLVKELNNSIVFLRKIARGGANKSFGIDVAALAGLPKAVTERARKILKQLEDADINNSRNKAAQVTLEFDKKNDNDGYGEIIKTLENIDINTTSPMEALNILSAMKEKLKA